MDTGLIQNKVITSIILMQTFPSRTNWLPDGVFCVSFTAESGSFLVLSRKVSRGKLVLVFKTEGKRCPTIFHHFVRGELRGFRTNPEETILKQKGGPPRPKERKPLFGRRGSTAHFATKWLQLPIRMQ